MNHELLKSLYRQPLLNCLATVNTPRERVAILAALAIIDNRPEDADYHLERFIQIDPIPAELKI
jgi:hypothetical protein